MGQARKGKPRALRAWSREAVLLTTLAALGIMFGVTEAAVGYYRGKQGDLAKMWFQQGTQALSAKKPKAAIQDFRNALNYAPDNATYQLRLAQAFAAANRTEAAESYLLDLWSREPGSGEINFELAQLEARRDRPDAARYFENAINGVWQSNTEQHRWQSRMLLFDFYRSRGDGGQAQAELVAMAADTPRTNYQRQTEIGKLQLESGNPRQALPLFQIALGVNRNYAPALAGAGAAEFAIGEYQRAIPDLESAVRLNPKNQEAASQLKMARMVLASDPFRIGLGEKERTARTVGAYMQALSTLASCASTQGVVLGSGNAQNPLQQAWASGERLRPVMTGFRGRAQTVLQVMNFVFSAEDLAAKKCGPLHGKDQALWLIGRIHQLTASSAQTGD